MATVRVGVVGTGFAGSFHVESHGREQTIPLL